VAAPIPLRLHGRRTYDFSPATLTGVNAIVTTTGNEIIIIGPAQIASIGAIDGGSGTDTLESSRTEPSISAAPR